VYHKYECVFYKKLNDQPDNWINTIIGTKPIIQVVMRAHFQFKAKPKLIHQKFETHDGREISFNDVIEVSETSDPESLAQDKLLIEKLCKSLSELDPDSFSSGYKSYFLSLYNKVRMCLFRRMVIVPLSVIRLSCSPNTAIILTGGKDTLMIRAVKNIAVGGPVTIGLSDEVILMPKEMRQQVIRSSRSIICDCHRCEAGDQENEVEELLPIQGFLKTMDRLIGKPDVQFIPVMIKGVAVMEKYMGIHYPQVVFFMHMTVHSMMQTGVHCGRREFDHLLDRLRNAIRITRGDDDAGTKFLLKQADCMRKSFISGRKKQQQKKITAK
jgi:hypothetical protein